MTALEIIARADLRIEFGYDLADPGILAVQGRDAVKLPNFSIVKLMVIVGIAALNLAAARILFLYNSEILIGVALIGVALQVGIFRLMRRRGRGRAFWVGFVVCGLTAMMAFVWVVRSPGVILVSSTGGYYKEHEPPMYSALCECRDVAIERVLYPILNSLHVDPMSHRDSKLLQASFIGFNAIVWFLPQLFIAMVGGLLTGLIGKRVSKMLVVIPRSQLQAFRPSPPLDQQAASQTSQ